MSASKPPFCQSDLEPLSSQQNPYLPATYHDWVYNVRRVNDNIPNFLQQDLNIKRLDEIYGWLWLAGRKMSARSLHRQQLYRRDIVVTEQIDLHLVWFEDTIYIKPLPDYLLNYSFWLEHLCGSPDLYSSALGFLLSYSWLVCHTSDFHVAKDRHLLPENIQFKNWVYFIDTVTANIDTCKVPLRYQYGELRLARINLIYRWTFRRFIRGYHVLHHRYSSFFERHFSWITITSFAYFALVLTAMQVGLATDGLKENAAFNNVSQWCAIVCIAFPLLVIATAVILFGFYFLYNAVATLRHQRSKRHEESRERSARTPGP